MSDEREPTRLVCAPLDSPHTADSIEQDGDCGHRVWVAAAGRRVIAEHPNVEVWCAPCALPELVGSGHEVMPAPGAMDDLAAEYGEPDRKGAEVVLSLLTALSGARKRRH